MLKKNPITITLYVLINIFHLQLRSDETNAALGAGLALFTATAMATRARIKSHENEIEFQTKIQKDAAIKIREMAARRTLQASTACNKTSLSNDNRQRTHNESPPIITHVTRNGYTTGPDYIVPYQQYGASASEIIQQEEEKKRLKQNLRDQQTLRKQLLHDIQQVCTNELVKKAVMSSLSNIPPTRQQELLATLASKERYRETSDTVKALSLRDTAEPLLNNMFCNRYMQKESKDRAELLLDNMHCNRCMQFKDTRHATRFFDQHVTSEVIEYAENPKEKIKANPNNPVRIATTRTFEPKNKATSKTIYIPVIHGTFATDDDAFGDNDKRDTTQALIHYAQHQAITENATVKLLILKWNGLLQEAARQESGKRISDLLVQEIKNSSHDHIDITFIAHSYGCDVSRHAIIKADTSIKDDTSLHNKNINFNDAYFFGSPSTILDVSPIIKDYHIHGDLDAVATAETFFKQGIPLTSAYKTTLYNPNAYADIRFKMIDETGKFNDLNHMTVKDAIHHLHLIPKIKAKYPNNQAIITIVDKKPAAQPNNDISTNSNKLAQHKMIHLIDVSNEINNNPVPESHIQAADQFKEQYQKLDPYKKYTYAQALESEAVANHVPQWAAFTMKSAVSLIELLLGNPNKTYVPTIITTSTSSSSIETLHSTPSPTTTSESVSSKNSPTRSTGSDHETAYA